MNVVVILQPYLSLFSKHVLEDIRTEKELNIVGAVIDTTPELSFKKKLTKNIQRGRGGYVFIMACHKLLRSKASSFNTKNLMAKWQVPVLETANPYTEECLNQISKFKGDAGVLISAFGIVKSPLINILSKGILSYHHGNMRHYRGQPPAFWELYHDEAQIGVTVQRVNRKLDRGEVILEKTFSIDKFDTLGSVERKIFRGSESMMKTALLSLRQPDFQGVFLNQYGKVYTLPNLRQWLRFKIKMMKRRAVKLYEKDLRWRLQ